MHKYKTIFINKKLQRTLLIVFVSVTISVTQQNQNHHYLSDVFMQSLLAPHSESEFIMNWGTLDAQEEAKVLPCWEEDAAWD